MRGYRTYLQVEHKNYSKLIPITRDFSNIWLPIKRDAQCEYVGFTND